MSCHPHVRVVVGMDWAKVEKIMCKDGSKSEVMVFVNFDKVEIKWREKYDLYHGRGMVTIEYATSKRLISILDAEVAVYSPL